MWLKIRYAPSAYGEIKICAQACSNVTTSQTGKLTKTENPPKVFPATPSFKQRLQSDSFYIKT